MPQNRKGVYARNAVGAVIGALLIVATGVNVVRAADDDDDALPDVKLMRRFMHALGLNNGSEGLESYKERPPLVVPPTRDLPPPASGNSLTQNNPAWPVDPDVKKVESQKKAKMEQRRLNNPNPMINEEGRSLTPAELQAGKTATPPTTTPFNQNAAAGIGQDQSSPSELGFTASMWKGLVGIEKSISKEPEIAKFEREPARATLTDPPPGYRTPSSAQPYGTNLSKLKPAAPTGDRQTEGTQGNPVGVQTGRQ